MNLHHRAVVLTVPIALAASGCAAVTDGDTSVAVAEGNKTYKADVLQVRNANDIVLNVDGKRRSVRLAEVRLPEPGECLSDEAQRQLEYRVGTYGVDVTDLGKDRAGRDLVRIEDPYQQDVATSLVADGVAVPDYEETNIPEAMRAARDEAVAGYHGMFNTADDCTFYSMYDRATKAFQDAEGWPAQETSDGATLLITALIASIQAADAAETFVHDARRDLRVLAYPPAELAGMLATLTTKRQRSMIKLVQTRQLKRHLLEKERRDRIREQEARAAFWRDWNSRHPSTNPGGSSESGSGGADAGYTGPRCYEPGGRVWHPC